MHLKGKNEAAALIIFWVLLLCQRGEKGGCARILTP
jgi:hypothetical protein